MKRIITCTAIAIFGFIGYTNACITTEVILPCGGNEYYCYDHGTSQIELDSDYEAIKEAACER